MAFPHLHVIAFPSKPPPQPASASFHCNLRKCGILKRRTNQYVGGSKLGVLFWGPCYVLRIITFWGNQEGRPMLRNRHTAHPPDMASLWCFYPGSSKQPYRTTLSISAHKSQPAKAQMSVCVRRAASARRLGQCLGAHASLCDVRPPSARDFRLVAEDGKTCNAAIHVFS